MSGPALAIEAIATAEGGVLASVRADAARLRTADIPGLCERAFAALPLLARHSCHNPAGASIRDELADTELAHLLEHVAIELLARGAPARGTRGETRWDFPAEGRGAFRVTIHHPDAAAASEALAQGAGLIATWAAGAPGDAEGAIAAVRAAASARGQAR